MGLVSRGPVVCEEAVDPGGQNGGIQRANAEEGGGQAPGAGSPGGIQGRQEEIIFQLVLI